MSVPVSPIPLENPRAALLWQLEAGVDLPLSDEVVSFHAAAPVPPAQAEAVEISPSRDPGLRRDDKGRRDDILVGGGEVYQEAVARAAAARDLAELKQAIADFDGIAIKRHATHLVFADGNRHARVMVVGEAPGADEDIQGLPFVGVSGQLLDKMLGAIGLSRGADDPATSVYISNILNWRPPGNRTPSPEEMSLSLPFIERHIALVAPKILILAGGVATKALLNTETGITRLRGKWANYRPITWAGQGPEIPAMPLYHPSFLLRTPTKKAEAWADLQLIQGEVQKLTH